MSPVDPFGEPVDLPLTLDGGQTFRWRLRADGWWEGAAGPWAVALAVDPDLAPGEVRVEGGEGDRPDGPVREAVARLLDLERDYGALRRRLLEREPALAPAVAATRGLRIVRLSPWEALLSFVLSSHTHIARIKQMLMRLCQAAGPEVDGEGLPLPAALAAMGEPALRRLGLGYRAAFVAAIAERLSREPGLLEQGAELPTAELVRYLQALPGVGAKVAHCVALFGYGRWDAFPIDRWARRALQAVYFDGRRVPMGRLRSFVQARFGELAGLAQAHLFAAARRQGTGRRRAGMAAERGEDRAAEDLPG